jgi:hypothetical protein
MTSPLLPHIYFQAERGSSLSMPNVTKAASAKLLQELDPQTERQLRPADESLQGPMQ